MTNDDLKHDMEMAAFCYYLGTHGDGVGATKWMHDAGLEDVIDALVETVHDESHGLDPADEWDDNDNGDPKMFKKWRKHAPL